MNAGLKNLDLIQQARAAICIHKRECGKRKGYLGRLIKQENGLGS